MRTGFFIYLCLNLLQILENNEEDYYFDSLFVLHGIGIAGATHSYIGRSRIRRIGPYGRWRLCELDEGW